MPLTAEQATKAKDGARQGRERRPERRVADHATAVARTARRAPDLAGPAPHAPLARRGGDQGALLFAAAIVSVAHDGGDRLLAAAARRSAFFGDVPIGDFLFGTKWTPLLARRPAVLRRPPADLGHALPDRHRAAGGRPARAAVRDLPVGVRPAARAQGRQAGARGARRRPDHRLRLLRADVLHARGPARTRSGSASTSSTRCRPGIILGMLVLPTIASVAEDAMSAVPQSLREGAFGPRRQQGADRAARRVPGRAVGRRRRARARRLARGRRDGDHPHRRRPAGATCRSNPYESYQSMAAFIAATARGDIPTGSIEYETIFVVGMTLFVDDAGAQPRVDPARPQVPAGVRMTGAQIAAARRAARRSSRAPTGGDRAFAAFFRALMYGAVGRQRSSRSATLLVDIARDGLAGPLRRTSSPASRRGSSRRTRGSSRRSWGTLYLMVDLRGDRRAARRRDARSTSRSTPTATKWWNRVIEVNIQNLAAVPSVVYGILGLAFIVRGPLVARAARCWPAGSRSRCSCCPS